MQEETKDAMCPPDFIEWLRLSILYFEAGRLSKSSIYSASTRESALSSSTLLLSQTWQPETIPVTHCPEASLIPIFLIFSSYAPYPQPLVNCVG